MLFIPLASLLSVVSLVFFDYPVAMLFSQLKLSGDVAKIFHFAEFFGHGYGVIIVCITVFTLDRNSRIVIPRIVAAVTATGCSVMIIKLLVSRTRPKYFDFTLDIYHSFCGWISPLSDGGVHSFPSGHTAAATALAIMLTWRYPQGRYLFASLAVCVALQRISCSAHYPSDTMVGALVGFLITGLFISIGPLPKQFDLLEKRLA